LSPRIEIRAATARDVGVVLRLIRGLAEYERMTHRVVATEAGLRESLFGERPAAEVVIAYAADEPVGLAVFHPTFSTFAGRPGLYLEDLFVEPAWRRHGIGKKLLAYLGRVAEERGCHGLSWSVLNWNAAAIRFYRSLGAEPVTEWSVMRLSGEPLARLAKTALVFVLLVFAAAHAEGIQQWRTRDGKLFFGDRPPAGSTLVGVTESMGTSGGGDVDESASAPRHLVPEPAPEAGGEAAIENPDDPVNAGVSLSKRNRLYFDTYSQRGLSGGEAEIVQRNLNAVRNDVGRELGVAPDARFQVVLTEPEVFHRYSKTGEHVVGLFNGKINLPIPAGIKESELQGTLWHEYSHAVIFSKVGQHCPTWLNEGIASHQQAKIDPSRREGRRVLLQPNGKLHYEWADLDRTFHASSSHADLDLAYRQALAIVDYLYERYGSRRVNLLIDAVGADGNFETALHDTLHLSSDELARNVADFIR